MFCDVRVFRTDAEDKRAPAPLAVPVICLIPHQSDGTKQVNEQYTEVRGLTIVVNCRIPTVGVYNDKSWFYITDTYSIPRQHSESPFPSQKPLDWSAKRQ